MTMCISCT